MSPHPSSPPRTQTIRRPPQHRMSGGDIPRGCKPGALGHAGKSALRASHQFLAAAFLVIVTQLASCVCPPFSRVALAATTHITESSSGAWVEYLDANGHEVGVTGQGGSHHQGDRYTDSDGNIYRCIEPHIMFMEGDYTQADISSSVLTNRAIERCALCGYWVERNVTSNHSGVVEQVLIWKILQQEGLVTDYLHNGTVDFAMRGYDTAAAFRDFNAWFEANHQNFETSATLWTNGYMQKLARFSVKSTSGKASIKKTSSSASLTADNTCYSLAGARYGIYKDKDCSQAMGNDYDLVTKANGESNTVELPLGTYWIREEEAPKGFILDSSPHKVVVEAGSNQFELADEPLLETPRFWATKHDIETDLAQGDATLEGAEFTVRFYGGSYSKISSLPSQPLRTWVFRSDAEGHIAFSDDARVRGDKLFYNRAGRPVLPLGTITIQETKAPMGYFLEGQDSSSASGYTAPVHLVRVTGENSYEAPSIAEVVKRGGVKLGKIDKERDEAMPQGDATLEGAVFAVVLTSSNPVVVDGVTYNSGDIVKRIVSDTTGMATSGDHDLPYGSYEIYEESAPTGYLADTGFRKSFTIRGDGRVVDLGNDICEDQVIRGGVIVGKVSRETSQHLSQGEANLSGATLSVTLDSEQPVLVDGTLHATGEVVCTLVTDENGIASTPDRALPYGTYTIREVEAPAGFLLNDSWSLTFCVRDDGVMYDFSDEANSVDDQVMRGGFSINKVSEASMERLSFAVFRITSMTTGESHIAVADENGLLNTEAYEHSSHTNINDSAVDDEGTVTEEYIAPAAGIWFSGRTDCETTPDDTKGALPYDVYRIEELRSSANEGMELVTFTIRIHSDQYTPDMGTIDDKTEIQPRIGTTLTYRDGLHMVPAADEILLTDTVVYENLKPDASYTLVGELVFRPNGDPVLDEDGNPVQTTLEFSPSTSSGTVNADFKINTSELEGRQIVAIEHLELDGTVVSTHADLEDEGQTVYVPSIGTTLTDAEGSHEVASGEQVSLVDTVEYHNLVPGKYYELTGTLMNKDSGEELHDESGQSIRSSSLFYAEEADGTATVTFVFDRSLAAGIKTVAFETLQQSGVGVATHADIEDEDQTVTVPHIRTSLTANDNTEHMRESGTIQLTDTVTYSGLTPGKTYELTGSLVDKDTGEPLADSNGNPITAVSSFSPSKASGHEDISFSFDASLLGERTLVAFESLTSEGREVAVHADLNDEAQTVRFPSIGTTLKGQGDTHEVCAGTQVTLVDVVSYTGLKPGASYVIEGTLMSKKTGKALKDARGNAVSSKVDLVPASSSGTADVSFTLDTNALAGTSVVAFEKLYQVSGDDLVTIATHEDLKDEGQTVRIPSIATKATNAQDGSQNITSTGTTKIKDKVTYKNLTPGKTYVMVGTLMSKSTGKPITGSNKKPITTKKEFVPKKASGVVELEFTLDPKLVTGTQIVAFESCQHDGFEVAAHADLSDADQTVTIKKPSNNKNPQKNPSSTSGTSSRQKTPRTGDDTISPFFILMVGILALGGGIARLAYVSYR